MFTVSKAFLRSKNIARVVLPLLICVYYSSVKSAIVATVECPFLNPPWSDVRKLFVSQNSVILLCTILSSNLPGSGSNDTGL